MNEVQSVVETAPVGYFMLGLVVIFAVLAFFDYLEFGLKRRAEKEGFRNPRLNELMENFRVYGMRGSTYSLVKGIAFTLMVVFTLYVGNAAISNLFVEWFG